MTREEIIHAEMKTLALKLINAGIEDIDLLLFIIDRLDSLAYEMRNVK